jgi:hypothetical protein
MDGNCQLGSARISSESGQKYLEIRPKAQQRARRKRRRRIAKDEKEEKSETQQSARRLTDALTFRVKIAEKFDERQIKCEMRQKSM